MHRLERHTLQTEGLRLEHALLPWDMAVFGCAVAQLEGLRLSGQDPARAAADFQRYRDWCHAERVALEIAKLPADQLAEIAFLEAQGFRWMETQYRLSWALQDEAPRLDPGLRVGPMQAADQAAVERVAATAFETSRYAMDAAIGPVWAGRRYEAWLRNAMQGQGEQQLLVAHGEQDELVGFFIVEQSADTGYWHLTAIDPTSQGQGYGLRLWRHMMAWQVARGVRRIGTSVSGHNLRVLGLYGRLGFRFAEAQVSLHRGGLPTGAALHAG